MYATSGIYFKGILELTKSKKGFVKTNDDKRIYVGNQHFSGALNGDVVRVKINYDYLGECSGEIDKIISRPGMANGR